LTSEEMENFTTVSVKRGSSLQVDLDIKTSGSVIRYGIIYNRQPKMRLIFNKLMLTLKHLALFNNSNNSKQK